MSEWTREWTREWDAWWDLWRSSEWTISRHPRRNNGYYVVKHRGDEITLKDSLELAKRFVERQTEA